jgi:ribosomal-protein-alanine N-acetyltransferase
MNKILYEFPTPFESKRLTLRSYNQGDGGWYYAMSVKNREHLSRYEADNVAADVASEEAAEVLVGELEAEWKAHRCFFIGAFDKKTEEFVAQIYVGAVDWSLPEFQIGYFADIDHEGQGFVTEGVRAVLAILFEQMNAHRVRLGCDETNLRSIRVAERLGMTREGYLRENRHNPDGTYNGSYIYGLLQAEYHLNSNRQAIADAGGEDFT